MRLKHCKPSLLNIAPKQLARIRLSNGIIVNPGRELSVLQIQNQPEVDWIADPNLFYTLLMIDADASHAPICHWLVINIPNKCTAEGQTLIEYNKPRLKIGSGLHRFIILIFQQTDEILEEKFVFKITKERHICVKTLHETTKSNLGQPIAGSFFIAKNV